MKSPADRPASGSMAAVPTRRRPAVNPAAGTLPLPDGEARFHALLEAAPDAMMIHGADGRIEIVNAQAEKLFGYARHELVGQSIMKQAGPAVMIQAIRQVLAGKVAVSDAISAAILESLARPGGSRDGSAVVGKLSTREFEILRLMGQGRDSHDIARALNLSVKTVDTHRGNIKTKLGLKNSTELIHYAVRWVGERP